MLLQQYCSLYARDAMAGTDVEYATTAAYAPCSTDVGYDARAAYAMCGTDIGYAGTGQRFGKLNMEDRSVENKLVDSVFNQNWGKSTEVFNLSICRIALSDRPYVRTNTHITAVYLSVFLSFFLSIGLWNGWS